MKGLTAWSTAVLAGVVGGVAAMVLKSRRQNQADVAIQRSEHGRRRSRAADEAAGTLIRDALRDTFNTAAEHIAVQVHHGLVTLRGEVASLDDIRDFEQVARSVSGVIDVDNLLRLPKAAFATSESDVLPA